MNSVATKGAVPNKSLFTRTRCLRWKPLQILQEVLRKKYHHDDINPPGSCKAGSPPSWRKGSFRKRNPMGMEVSGQQLLLCLAIPAGCNSGNTPNNICQPGSLNSEQLERSRNWKLGSAQSTGPWHSHGLCDLQGLFQPEFHGQNSPSRTCRELSVEQIPVEPPVGHCGCRALVGRVHLPPCLTTGSKEHNRETTGKIPVLAMDGELGTLSLPCPP